MRSVFRMFALVLLLSAATIGRADEILRVSRMVMANQVLSAPPAVYPEDAKAAGVEGTVVLDVVVSAAGIAEQVIVLSGPDKLRDAAKDAVNKWTYKPYLLDGVATEVDTKVWVEFSLKGGVSRNASADATALVVTTSPRVYNDPLGSLGSAASSTVPRPAPVRVAGGLMAGHILNKVAPDYPRSQRQVV